MEQEQNKNKQEVIFLQIVFQTEQGFANLLLDRFDADAQLFGNLTVFQAIATT